MTITTRGFSVAGKLALGAMLLVLASVAATSYAAMVRQTRALEAAEERSADLLASAVAVLAAQDLIKNDVANLQQTARRLCEANPTLRWVAISDADGKRLASFPLTAPAADAVLTQVYARTIAVRSQSFGRLELLFDRMPILVAQQEAYLATSLVAAVLLVIALVVTLFWSHLFSQPIAALARAAEKIAAGDLTVKLPVRSHDEIGSLTERFNGMVANLDRTTREREKTLNELSTLYSVARIINSTSDREEIMKLNIETLATGFKFTRAAILLEIDHVWRLVALHDGSASRTFPTATAESFRLADLGLDMVSDSEGALRVAGDRFPAAWGFTAVDAWPIFAVALRSGSNPVGILVAGGEGASEEDADKVLSVIASQIAPPLLISLMVEREMSKLSNPFEYIARKIDKILLRAGEFGVNVTLLVFHFRQEVWLDGAAAAERCFDEVTASLKAQLPELEIAVRYGANRIVAVLAGVSRQEARATLMRLEYPHAELVTTAIVTSPDDGQSAHELLSLAESSGR